MVPAVLGSAEPQWHDDDHDLSACIRAVEGDLQSQATEREKSVRIEQKSRELSQLREELCSLEAELQAAPDTAPPFVAYGQEQQPDALFTHMLYVGLGVVAAAGVAGAQTTTTYSAYLYRQTMLKAAVLGLVLGLGCPAVIAGNPRKRTYRLYVGGAAIHAYDMDDDTGTITPITSPMTDGECTGSFLAVSQDGKRMYTTAAPGAAAFNIESGTGKLRHINTVPTPLAGNAHISVAESSTGGQALAILSSYGNG